MATSKIESELLKAVGEEFKARKDGEKLQKYLGRLTAAVNDLTDKTWAKISKPAQDWTEAAMEAIEKKKDIDDFADRKDEEKPKDDDKPKGEEKSDKDKKGDKDKSDKDKTSDKKPDKDKKEDKKSDKPKDDKKRGASRKYRETVIKHRDWDRARLLKEVVDAGYTLTPASADIVYYEAKAMLTLLEEKGLLRDKAEKAPAKEE